MFYLRTIQGGVESNFPLGEKYTKVDILRLNSLSTDGEQLIKQLLKMQPSELPTTNILLFSQTEDIALVAGVDHAISNDFGEKNYIVDSRGNTFDTLVSKPIDPQQWAELLDSFEKNLQ